MNKNNTEMKNNIYVVPIAWQQKQIKRKIRKRKKRNIILEVLKEYCSNTTIHGIGYIGDSDRSLLEKIWWIICFILSVIACSYLIAKTWIKWKENPVILSFEKEQTPIWNIPFPAVTVCPVNKIEQSIYNYTKMFRKMNNLTDQDSKEFWDISLLCKLEQYDEEFNCTFNFTDESAIETMRKYAPLLTETIFDVKWQNTFESVHSFAEHLTEEGICFTFNSFSQADMYTDELTSTITYIDHNVSNNGYTLEDGYNTKFNKNDLPRRSIRDGSSSSLNFKLQWYGQTTDYICGMPVSGYKLILHNPADTPKATQQYFLIPLDTKVTLILTPELTSTSTNLRSLSPNIKKCYFSNEKSLKFFKVYSQDNCRVECAANLTQEFCGCVPFYMPRNKNTFICGYAQAECIKQVEDLAIYFEMAETISNITEEEQQGYSRIRQIYDKCKCLPSCTSLYYTAETSQTQMKAMKGFVEAGLLNEYSNNVQGSTLKQDQISTTEVDIFFKESQFLALHRSELYGQTDFLANCGGLLGLFMGFSILSLVEIIYFMTLRMWIKMRTQRKMNLVKSQ